MPGPRVCSGRAEPAALAPDRGGRRQSNLVRRRCPCHCNISRRRNNKRLASRNEFGHDAEHPHRCCPPTPNPELDRRFDADCRSATTARARENPLSVPLQIALQTMGQSRRPSSAPTSSRGPRRRGRRRVSALGLAAHRQLRARTSLRTDRQRRRRRSAFQAGSVGRLRPPAPSRGRR